ncbi:MULTISPECIES: hypothetical protein [Erwiniaceae]|uniref:cold shock small protein YmcF n=1 Tax=Erwiniaceae TaxID=1903409 RepID=UPI003AF1728D
MSSIRIYCIAKIKQTECKNCVNVLPVPIKISLKIKICRSIIQNIKYQCPSCHGCQYRFSPFSITAKNPHGANCIFCKSQMVCLPATVSQN